MLGTSDGTECADMQALPASTSEGTIWLSRILGGLGGILVLLSFCPKFSEHEVRQEDDKEESEHEGRILVLLSFCPKFSEHEGRIDGGHLSLQPEWPEQPQFPIRIHVLWD